jgi:hypothetical protein
VPTFELEDGRLVVLNKGIVERVPTLEEEPLLRKMIQLWESQEMGDKIISQYVTVEPVEQSISKEVDNIAEFAANDTGQMKNLFYEALTKSDKIKGVALLEILAAAGSLQDLLTDERFSNLFLTSLRAGGNLQGVERLRVSPKSPQNVKSFVRFVLQDRLALDESTAARNAVKIGNLLGDEYKDIAYFDVKESKFKWM